MINPDFTILIQGPYSSHTANLSLRLHEIFPSHPIIISCYNEDVEPKLLHFATIVRCEDPGTSFIQPSMKPLNLNRQATTIWTGCQKIKTKWVMKLRSDLMILDKSKFKTKTLDFFALGDKDDSLSCFTMCTGSFNIFSYYQMPFHLHDWFFITLTEELTNNCFVAKDINEQKLVENFEPNEQKNYRHGHRYQLRFHTEQLIHFGSKIMSQNLMKHCCDMSSRTRAKFLIWAAKSLQISTLHECGVKSAKVRGPSFSSSLVGISNLDLFLYQQYVKSRSLKRGLIGVLLVLNGKAKSAVFLNLRGIKKLRSLMVLALKMSFFAPKKH